MKYKKEEPIENCNLGDAYMLYALINVLGNKGLITKEEVLNELDRLEKNAIIKMETKLN